MLNIATIYHPESSGKYQAYTRGNIVTSKYWAKIPQDIKEAILVISAVLPFRTNEYVMSKLINWENVPDDPIFRLNFPHQSMLESADYDNLRDLLFHKENKTELDLLIYKIRMKMNPHPSGQMTHNVPVMNGHSLKGIQHKYRETALFFPSAGQTCHAYCTFCFRWAQFVGMEELKFDAKSSTELVEYLRLHRDISDVLVTGGDPLIMKARSLANYLEPLLSSDLSHVQTIRIGTKSVAYWPDRFVTDSDSDELLRLFEKIIKNGKHLAIMGHYNHPTELKTDISERAISRILSTGAVIRMQSPLVKHINDQASIWVEMWNLGVKQGLIPYYMFVERDTGPKKYFDIPLVKAHEIFSSAYSQVSGLARTVRGPSMSAFPGKVVIDGIVEIERNKMFVLKFIQARNPEWIGKPFLAKYDENATWLTDLTPSFEKSFFFESP